MKYNHSLHSLEEDNGEIIALFEKKVLYKQAQEIADFNFGIIADLKEEIGGQRSEIDDLIEDNKALEQEIEKLEKKINGLEAEF